MDMKSIERECRSQIIHSQKFQRALSSLLEASSYAEKTRSDIWDFAICLHEMQEFGLSANDLRFLIRLSYIRHECGHIKAVRTDHSAHFPADLALSKRSRFVLTPKGIEVAVLATASAAATCVMQRPVIRLSAATLSVPPVPNWDSQRRILFFEGKVVKRFKCHAVNQEIVLTTFQEEDWPIRILDPLAPCPTQVVKGRLAETIKSLNRGHIHSLIHFRGDGSGEGVVWEAAH